MTLKNLLTINLVFLFLQLTASSFGQADGDEYKTAISQADNYFKSGDYINAKAAYQYANRLKPEEEYPKKRLQETINLIRDKMVVVEQFGVVVAEADKYFRTGEYEKATVKYTEAKKILPEDPYPDQQIAEIKRLGEEALAKQKEFDDAIANAEKFTKFRKYELAKAEYEKAFAVKPIDSKIKDKISELEILIEETNKAKSAYEETIAGADRLYNLKYYENARKEYEKALNAKPDEDYPASQIREIDKILVQKGEYDHLVEAGDEFYMNKDLEKAKSNYQAALKIYPDESYPKTMIDKVNQSLSTTSSKDELYQKAVSDADQFLLSNDYTNALKEYENANALKPFEKYPSQKIAEVKELMNKIAGDELEYNKAVQRGEQLLAQKDYSAARNEFNKANGLKPSEAYPKEKVAEINKILNKQDEMKAGFDLAVGKAEQYLQKMEYDKAIAEYQNALIIIPGDKSVSDKIEEINRIKSSIRDKDNTISGLMTEADDLFAKSLYTDARAKYNEVLQRDPVNEKAKNRIGEIDLLIAERREKDNDFNKAVASGDIFFKNNELEKAREEYQKAVSIKPVEKYPSEKLSEIAVILDGAAAQQTSYDQLIASADKLFSDGKYEQAKIEYQKALDLKPGEKYPAAKIAEIVALMDSVVKEDKEYNDAIAQADGLFNLQKYEEANLIYIKAANIKTKEKYPRDKMVEIDQIINSQKANVAQYNQYIAAGDRMMETKEYDKASEKYNLALATRPDEQYPADKLKEIESIIAGQELLVQDSYNKTIAEADAHFTRQEYDQARIKYQNALKFKPEETYPVQKLGEIEGLVSDLKTLQTNYARLIADADVKFKAKEFYEAKSKYMEASALFPKEEYPVTKIEEINLYFKTEHTKLQQSYDKSIADADKFFASGIFDQALEGYRAAKKILPDETYPDEMIGRILGILDANAVRNLVATPIIIANNEEKKLTFEPVPVADRKNNMILIKAGSGSEGGDFKVVMSYGKGGSKNGGIVLPFTAGQLGKEYIIPIGKQYTWFSQDNDWISLIPQGGQVELSLIKITKGE